MVVEPAPQLLTPRRCSSPDMHRKRPARIDRASLGAPRCLVAFPNPDKDCVSPPVTRPRLHGTTSPAPAQSSSSLSIFVAVAPDCFSLRSLAPVAEILGASVGLGHSAAAMSRDCHADLMARHEVLRRSSPPAACPCCRRHRPRESRRHRHRGSRTVGRRWRR
eukprot:scaffold8005_cov391-Pinguiococcus_pyrenoidosus.AAC.2